jgi:hypothetical protein
MVEYHASRIREKLFGVDGAVFDKAIRFFSEKRGVQLSRAEALARAQDKLRHKNMWYGRERKSVEGGLSPIFFPHSRKTSPRGLDSGSGGL